MYFFLGNPSSLRCVIHYSPSVANSLLLIMFANGKTFSFTGVFSFTYFHTVCLVHLFPLEYLPKNSMFSIIIKNNLYGFLV